MYLESDTYFQKSLNSGLWAGLDCEKKVWADYEQLFRPVFLGSIFYGGKTNFFRAKNLSVITKTL